MENGQVILRISINQKFYCVFLSKTNTIHAFAFDKKGKFYFVNEKKEINIINKAIEILNKKYIRRKNVLFNNQELARFENKYNHLSYFAIINEDDTYTECSYEKYRDLYNEYNGIKTCFDYHNFSSSHDSDRSYKFSVGDDSLDDYDIGEFSNSSYNSRRKNGTAKKVVLAIGGLVLTVGITFSGFSLLKKERISKVSEVSEVYEEQELVINNIDNNSIQSLYGYDIDLIADDESEQANQKKYKKIEDQLKSAGLANWEIAIELDEAAILNSDSNISFYYDCDKDEIVYVYQELPIIEDTIEEENFDKIEFSDDIKLIIDAVKQNQNLTEEEKDYIIKSYSPIWQKNEKYINCYELASRFKNLILEYNREEKKELKLEYTPSNYSAGICTCDSRIINTQEDYNNNSNKKTSYIQLYNVKNFDDVFSDSTNESTALHELNHLNGNFSPNNPSLLNEGYTQLSSKKRDYRYEDDQLMVILLVETFGKETIKAGYYGFDLNQELINVIVEKTGRNADDVNDEIYILMEEIQEVLYGFEKSKLDDVEKDKQLLEKFNNVYLKLADYYEKLTGRKFDENQIANCVVDIFTGSRKSNIYVKDNERIDGIENYDVDTGELSLKVLSWHDEINYEDSLQIVKKPNAHYSRFINLNDNNKYSITPEVIKDNDINYLSR